ncbi:MAG: hypothetical protein NT118_14855 [Lentisphaerae bacterium]|nr:hypothetical protein [Lentisphaerota bacterium]
MNKRICAMILGTMFAVAGLIFAQDSPNLLKNSELKIENNKLTNWFVSCKISSDAGYKGKNSVRGTLEKQEERGKTIMIQDVADLKPGKYIFSANIKLDRKINDLVLIMIIKLDGKDDYQGTHLQATDQPEAGAWGKVMCEFTIPAGINSATVAFDLRDDAPGATFWVDSPVLTYKPE